MTSELIDSQLATEAEVAAAKAEAEAQYQRSSIQQGAMIHDAANIPGTVKPMTYRIPEEDQGSWVMVWELKVDANGQEYGIPRRAPRQQLGLWLQKRREFDGGLRFTVDMPNRIAAEAQFKCLHQECRKRLYTRQDLVDHVENAHAREARLYRKLLDQIMDQAANDNPRVRELAETYAQMPDRGIVSVEVNPQPREEGIDVNAGAPTVQSLGGVSVAETDEIFRCRKGDCKRFFDSAQGRLIHEGQHKKED